MRGLTRRSLLAGAAAAALPLPACADAPPGLEQRPGLGTVAAGNGILFGACSRGLISEEGPLRIAPDAKFAALFGHECRMMTTEYQVKMPNIRPEPDHWDFRPADLLMKYATDNKMAFRGHCLLWSAVLPRWFSSTVNEGNAQSFITDHIHTVCGRYAGRVVSWDVANEAITDGDDATEDGLRKGPLLSLLGPQYLDIAFKAAHEADPTALLCLNQDAVEYDHASQAFRRAATLNTLRRMLDAQVPIHALGIQSHLEPNYIPFSADVFGQFLEDVAALGLKIFITELDVIDRRLPADIAARDQGCAAALHDYLAVALAQPAVAMVNCWGLSDRYNWIEDSDLRRKDGLPSRAQLCDDRLAPKPAYDAVAATLGAGPARTAIPARVPTP